MRSGDEVVVAPGEYSDFRGDLGLQNQVLLPPNIVVHGVAGQPRPVIRLGRGFDSGAMTVITGDVVSHLEIVTADNPKNITILGGVVEDLVARSSTPLRDSVVCNHIGGILRSSACLTSSPRATAVGTDLRTAASGLSILRLRNVTAVATGAESFGLNYLVEAFNGATPTFEIGAGSVIAEGTFDISAGGERGARVNVNLDHSDYASTIQPPAAVGFVTPPGPIGGDPTNIIAPPLLAADGFHQRPNSPTLEKGNVDGFSAQLDADGQQRSIGTSDIGADELAHSSLTSLACTPPALTVGGGPTTCTAKVTDTLPGPSAPQGTVRLATDGAGAFDGSCVLSAPQPMANESTCTIVYRPSAAGARPHTLTASYPGDLTHDASAGATGIAVAAAPESVGDPPNVEPQTRLGKRPRKKGSKRIAAFTFTSDQAGAAFECKLDKKPFRRCASPFKAKVKPGRHTFRVRAVDSLGLADSTPAVFIWTVGQARR